MSSHAPARPVLVRVLLALAASVLLASCAHIVAGSAVPGTVLLPVTTPMSVPVPTPPLPTPKPPEASSPDQSVPGVSTTASRTSPSTAAVRHRGTVTGVDAAGVTVAVGAPKVAIELYSEPLCPPCAEFHATDGKAVDAAVDSGKLAVTYRTLTFLDQRSASGDYSTRAAAALICVGRFDGKIPGLYQDFYGALFSPGTQPQENGNTDLTNGQLADLARRNGASTKAATCIRDGGEKATAIAANTTGQSELAAAGGSGTPSVVHNGKTVDHRYPGWLADLLG